jgi:hypothetical protein
LEQQKGQDLQEHGPQHGGESASSRDGDQSKQGLREAGVKDFSKEFMQRLGLNNPQERKNDRQVHKIDKGKIPQIVDEQYFEEIAKKVSKKIMELPRFKKMGEKGPLTREEQQATMTEANAVLREFWDYEGGAQMQLFLENVKKEGRGDKTVESATSVKVQAMVNKWRGKGLSNATRIDPRRVLENFPEIELATALEKEYYKLDRKRIILLKLPGEIREVFNREWSSKMLTMQKEYQSLEKLFPEKPDDVVDRKIEIDRKSREKAQEMVGKWQTEGLTGAYRVNEGMVLKNFPELREAIALEIVLEKASNDVPSVRQRLQKAKEQFPKNPSEVIIKEE